MSSIQQQHQGTDKARGLENAALQHLKHKTEQQAQTTVANPQVPGAQQPQSNQQVQPAQTTTAVHDPHVAAKVELNKSVSTPAPSYSPSTVLTNTGKDTTIIGNGAKVNINSTVGVDNGNDTLIIGNGAKVNINSTVGVDNGNDTLIVGNGAKVNIESHVGVDNSDDTAVFGNGSKVDIKSSVGIDNGNDTLIIGNGAKVTINSRVGVDNSNDTLIIENGAKVEINATASAAANSGKSTVIIGNQDDVKIDGTIGLGNDAFTYKDGKLSVQLKDDKNQNFRWELNVKNQQDAETLMETIKNKLKEKQVTFEDLRSTVQDQQSLMKQRDDLIKQFKEGQQDNPFVNKGKGFNRFQNQLDMQFSLVKQLMTPAQGKSEESIHVKISKLAEQLHDLHSKKEQ